MKKTVKIGVFGLDRGGDYLKSVIQNDGEVVAVCDKLESRFEYAKKIAGNDVATYTDFDSFIEHPGLEAILVANYFCQHVPFVIKALERNIHVLCECASNSTMAEGVALVRAAEKSDAIYMLAENYPFMKFNLEMKRVVEGGTLGKILYAEGEYNHPQNPAERKYISEVRPFEKHWRNYLPRSYYITHSLGPLMHITGAFPIRVSAMPVYAPNDPDYLVGLDVGDRAAIITCLNSDDSVFKVTGCAAFGAHGNSYRVCGTDGQIENLRDGTNRISLSYNSWCTPDGLDEHNCYDPDWAVDNPELVRHAGHGGSDFLVAREFLDCIREGRKPFFDVYAATTMASVGILAHRSILNGGIPYDIPDFRMEEDRAKYENDNLTPFYGPDGSEPTVPCCSHPDFVPKEEDVEDYRKMLRGE